MVLVVVMGAVTQDVVDGAAVDVAVAVVVVVALLLLVVVVAVTAGFFLVNPLHSPTPSTYSSVY